MYKLLINAGILICAITANAAFQPHKPIPMTNNEGFQCVGEDKDNPYAQIIFRSGSNTYMVTEYYDLDVPGGAKGQSHWVAEGAVSNYFIHLEGKHLWIEGRRNSSDPTYDVTINVSNSSSKFKCTYYKN